MSKNRNRADLAQFLRSRRERIMPAHVGLPAGRRRRTPGLRREEIAVLAGLSPTWYTYLEQGREIRPSPEVLESLARVLRLSEDERGYLHLLAGGQGTIARPPQPPPANESFMWRIVESMDPNADPVYSSNVYADITAWNASAALWYTDFGAFPDDRRNMLWWMLTAPEARERLLNWEDDTRDVLAQFRVAAAARPWDERFEELVSAFHTASPEFRDWWPDYDVRGQHPRLRRVRLPCGEARTVRLVILRMTDSFNSVVLHVPEDHGTAFGF